MNNLELIKILKNVLKRPIAFYPVFFDITQNLNAAIFLSQFWYWSEKMEFDWIYKSADSWQKETKLSVKQQRQARKLLKQLGLLDEKLKKIAVGPVVHFRFNLEAFVSIIQDLPSKPYNSPLWPNVIYPNVPERLWPNVPEPIYTETTTENTNTTIADTVSPSLVLDLYHDELKALPKVKVFTEKRKRQVKATIKNYPKAKDPDWWRRYFQKANEIPFLHGENDRKWCADFDFLTKFDNIVKVIEGKYEK